MEAKTFLKQYQEALVDVRNLEAETEELETIALSITVLSLIHISEPTRP